MFEKLVDCIEKFFDWIEKDREKQAEKIKAKRAAYLDARRKKVEAESKRALLEELQRKADQKRKKLSSYTTVEEYRKIVESSQYKRMSEKEREIFLRRRNELRRKDAKFEADYEKWLSEELRRKNPKFKAEAEKQLSENTGKRKEIRVKVVTNRRVRCI